MDIASGSILIDGISHIDIPLHLLRSRLVVLPQQPYLLEASIRRNMDPENRSSDLQIRRALERVRLWDTLTSSSSAASDPLNKTLNSDTLSPGQKQLFCLARAILHIPHILFLDEATSSLDTESDAVIQELIRTEFSANECTVVAIAHRLRSIVDFDTVAVVEDGEIVEIGSPETLMGIGNGQFRKMCMEQSV
jgi:ATP-binding cassette, subfamily C (CFTR/MRP), member 1